ncbi:MAG TPA: MerR family transcriptional regulator [Nevskiales bacterium]|nr:MerR family transcriptional regulator [Nevskiales bacterium]
MNSTSESANMTIGARAGAAGVNVETIRFYQRKGLMPEPDRLQGRIRRYSRDALGRVRFIKAAQRLGCSLDEVADLLELEDGTHCEQARVRDLIEAWRDARRTAWQTTVKVVTTAMLAAPRAARSASGCTPS